MGDLTRIYLSSGTTLTLKGDHLEKVKRLIEDRRNGEYDSDNPFLEVRDPQTQEPSAYVLVSLVIGVSLTKGGDHVLYN